MRRVHKLEHEDWLRLEEFKSNLVEFTLELKDILNTSYTRSELTEDICSLINIIYEIQNNGEYT